MKFALTPLALLLFSLPAPSWSQVNDSIPTGGSWSPSQSPIEESSETLTAGGPSPALAQGVPATSVAEPDAQTEAIGSELYAYLTALAGSESRLYEIVTGTPKMGNQQVMLLLNSNDVDSGKLVYSGARLIVNSWVLPVGNCGRSQDSTTLTETRTFASNASWSAAQSQSSTKSHTISVSSGVSAFGASVSVGYSFSSSTTNSTSTSTTDGQQQTTQTSWSTVIKKDPGTVTTYRRDWITLSAGDAGNSIPYTLNPVVNGNAQVVFSVQTIGYNYLGVASGIFGAGGPGLSALSNVAPVGQALPAASVAFPINGILWSADGRFAYGMLNFPANLRGSFGVVDLAKSPSAAQADVLWASGVCSHYAASQNFITQTGNITWMCGSHMNTDTRTTASNGCFYMAFSRAYPGILACYDRDVSQMDPITAESYRHARAGKYSTQAAMPNQNAVSYMQYSVPLAKLLQALKQPAGDVKLTLTGTFAGHDVLFYSDCTSSVAAHAKGANCVANKPYSNAVCGTTTDYMKRSLPGLNYSVQYLDNNFDVAGPN